MSKAVVCDVCRKVVKESDSIETHGAKIQIRNGDIYGEHICNRCMKKHKYSLVKFGYGEGSEYCIGK